ncbi:vacuolar protein 8-like [Nymphaea colorata]|nr:vacuolar protein 8-like [Nymphaea colorata]
MRPLVEGIVKLEMWKQDDQLKPEKEKAAEELGKHVESRQQEYGLRRAVELIASVTVGTHSTRTFPVKWQSIRAKLDRLHSDLSKALLLLDSASASDNGGHAGELSALGVRSIIATLHKCAAMAHICTELTYSGKLLMQSDLDKICGRLDEHLRRIDAAYQSGALAAHALAIVVSRPPAGAPREDVQFFVRDLFTRVQIGTRAMKVEALRALEEIVCEEKYQRIVVQTGEVAQLVVVLESDDVELSNKAARILAAIARNEEHKAELVSAGVIPPAIRLLEKGRGQGREAAAVVLNRLTAYSENAWSVSSLGGVTASLAACHTTESVLRREAAGILRNLAGVEEIRRFMVDEGVASVVIRLLNAGDDDTKIYATDCLRMMSSGDGFSKNLIVKEGGVQSLVSTLGSKSPECRELALQAIGNLVSSPNSAKIVVLSGFLGWIPLILRFGEFGKQQPAVRAVRDLVKLSDEAKRAAGDAGIMPELLKLLDAKSVAVREMAAEAISEILTVPKSRNKFVQEDHNIVRVLQVLDSDTGTGVRHFLLLGLISVSGSPTGRRKIASSDKAHAVERLAAADDPEARRILRRIAGSKFKQILGGIWRS